MLIPTYPKSPILHVIALAFVFSQSMMIASESTNSAQQKCPSTIVAPKSTNTTQQGLDNHALVIAIGDYSGWERWNNLPAVYNDARRIKIALRHQWKITYAKNLEIDCLEQVIKAFFESATGTQRLLLYYAGHGLAHLTSASNSASKPTAHLIPSKAKEPTNPTGWSNIALPVAFVFDQIDSSRAREVLVVFDACMLGEAVYANFNRVFQTKHRPSGTVSPSGTADSLNPILRGFITSGYAATEVSSKSYFNDAFTDALQFQKDDGADSITYLGVQIPTQKTRERTNRDSKIDADELYYYTLIHLHQKQTNRSPASFDPQHFWSNDPKKFVLLTESSTRNPHSNGKGGRKR